MSLTDGISGPSEDKTFSKRTVLQENVTPIYSSRFASDVSPKEVRQFRAFSCFKGESKELVEDDGRMQHEETVDALNSRDAGEVHFERKYLKKILGLKKKKPFSLRGDDDHEPEDITAASSSADFSRNIQNHAVWVLRKNIVITAMLLAFYTLLISLFMGFFLIFNVITVLYEITLILTTFGALFGGLALSRYVLGLTTLFAAVSMILALPTGFLFAFRVYSSLPTHHSAQNVVKSSFQRLPTSSPLFNSMEIFKGNMSRLDPSVFGVMGTDHDISGQLSDNSYSSGKVMTNFNQSIHESSVTLNKNETLKENLNGKAVSLTFYGIAIFSLLPLCMIPLLLLPIFSTSSRICLILEKEYKSTTKSSEQETIEVYSTLTEKPMQGNATE